jgi:hypothetical protein
MLQETYEVENKPLMNFALTAWHEVIEDIHSPSARKALSVLMIQLLDPNEPHYLNLRNEVAKIIPSDSRYWWSAEPGAVSCATLASLCWYGFIEAAQMVLEMQENSISFSGACLLECRFHAAKSTARLGISPRNFKRWTSQGTLDAILKR